MAQEMEIDMDDFNPSESELIAHEYTASFITGYSQPVPIPIEIDESDFPSLLRLFYQRFFPFKDYVNWLSYGDLNYLAHREFSFTLATESYLRYQSFKDAEHLKDEILRFNPYKIDIGAIYSAKPCEKNSLRPGAFKPLEKELIFDIDMTDYDEIRTCCSGGAVCMKCWDFMTIAIKVIDRALREDFGFQHLLWVYSGRRGIHCWVCDERARKLGADVRKAIVSYFDVVKGGENINKKVYLPEKLHPSLLRAYEILKEYFVPLILEKQNAFGTQERWEKLLSLVPEKSIVDTLRENWSNMPDMRSEERWEDLSNEINAALKKKGRKNSGTHTLDHVLRDIIFQYTYPRLDVHVSTGINHLLKSPFCIHPKTGRVCVPINPQMCDGFNPFDVPKVGDLARQLTEFDEKNPDSEVADFEKTSLKHHIKYFRQLLAARKAEIRAKKLGKVNLIRKRRFENAVLIKKIGRILTVTFSL